MCSKPNATYRKSLDNVGIEKCCLSNATTITCLKLTNSLLHYKVNLKSAKTNNTFYSITIAKDPFRQRSCSSVTGI